MAACVVDQTSRSSGGVEEEGDICTTASCGERSDRVTSYHHPSSAAIAAERHSYTMKHRYRYDIEDIITNLAHAITILIILSMVIGAWSILTNVTKEIAIGIGLVGIIDIDIVEAVISAIWLTVIIGVGIRYGW